MKAPSGPVAGLCGADHLAHDCAACRAFQGIVAPARAHDEEQRREAGRRSRLSRSELAREAPPQVVP